MESIPLEPDEMRALEPYGRESPYGSRSASPVWQNTTNLLEDLLHSECYLPSRTLKSWYLQAILALYWLFAAWTLTVFEENTKKYNETEVEERTVSDRRALFLQRFAQVHYHTPFDSMAWERSVQGLIMWYERDTFPLQESTTKWNFSNALLCAGSLAATIGPLPGNPSRCYLSTDLSRAFLIVWAPFAIFAYYYCVWKAGHLFCITLGFQLRACIVCIVAFSLLAWLVTQLLYSQSHFFTTAHSLVTVVVTIGERQAGDENRADLSKTSVHLFIHFLFWTALLRLILFLKKMKRGLLLKIVSSVSRSDLLNLPDIAPSKYVVKSIKRQSKFGKIIPTVLLSRSDMRVIDDIIYDICKLSNDKCVQTD